MEGQNRDLVNLWRNVDVSAGDELIFKLAWLQTHHYTLNHYYKGVMRQTFVQRYCWQLVPAVFEMESQLQAASPDQWAYDYRIHRYWRIVQCFQHRASFEADPINICDDTNFLRGQLLQVTFAPVWTQFLPLNAPDPVQPSPTPQVLRRDSPQSHIHAQRASSAAKRAYLEAFGELEPAASYVLFGVPRAGKPSEIKKWNLSSGATSSLAPVLAAAPNAAPAAAAPAGVLAKGAASSTRELAPRDGPATGPASPAACQLQPASMPLAAAGTASTPLVAAAVPPITSTMVSASLPPARW